MVLEISLVVVGVVYGVVLEVLLVSISGPARAVAAMSSELLAVSEM